METELRTITGKKVFPFMRLKWIFISVSIFFFALGIYEIAVKGLNFGVDFLGGVKTIYKFGVNVDAQSIRGLVDTLELGEVQVVQFGMDPKANQYLLRAKYIEGKDVAAILNKALAEKFGADSVTVLTQEVVGPAVGHDMRKKAFLSIGLCWLLILIYVGFRFDFLFAPGGVVALLHDLVVTTGVFAFFGKEFNLTILAALLTILGFSINDTIVIYDRVRENIALLPKKTRLTDIIDISVTETMRRTIVTSLTVFLVLLALYFLGGPVLNDFAFCLLVGVIFGCYSTIFIASPVYLFMQKLFPHKGLKKMDLPETPVKA